MHAPDAFRLAEGFIVLMRSAGIDAYFDWDSGYHTDDHRPDSEEDLMLRIKEADICMFLCSEQALLLPGCRRAFEFALSLNRPLYVVHTRSGNTEWKPQIQSVYSQLTVQDSPHASGSFIVKVLDMGLSQLWKMIHSVENL